MDPSRRAQLLSAKLRVLAASAGADGLTPLGFPGGAAASGNATLWVLGDGLGAGVLGPALAIALRDETCERLVAITDESTDAAVIARRAEEFARPSIIDAASVNDTTLSFCASNSVLRAEFDAQNELEDVIRAVGAEPVWEHGVLRAEVRGLEIARVDDGQLAVGVGRHDREGHRMANPDADPVAALQSLADRVRLERTADAPSGLMTSLARERWLRAVVIAHPELVGAAQLTAVEPPSPRSDLRVTSIAPAVGDAIVVACSVGVDPDLVPAAADVRAQHAPGAEIVLVVPEGDDVASTHRLAGALKQPARVVTVPSNWAALGD
ncbi:MAG: hypothetical protein QOF21_2134 [Actinomycetota bacterium]